MSRVQIFARSRHADDQGCWERSSSRCHLLRPVAQPRRWYDPLMMLTIDEIAERYKITRASAIIRMAVVSDFGGRYDENTVKRIMEPQQDALEPTDDDDYQCLHDEVGF